ncbi:MAG TPA: hypothetical protein VIU42_19755, partial [Xanthobacteraceae bacterium]
MVPRRGLFGRGGDCVFAIRAAGGHMKGNKQEPALANNPKPPAEGQIAKAQRQADGKKAMAEYEASAEAMRAKTEKLRALRLARDAANPPAAAPKKTASGRATKSGKKEKAPKGTLADWLTEQ